MVEGRTIAVDPSVIPYGTQVIINGHIFTAEDCGGAIKGNRIDIYVSDHDRANALGVNYGGGLSSEIILFSHTFWISISNAAQSLMNGKCHMSDDSKNFL